MKNLPPSGRGKLYRALDPSKVFSQIAILLEIGRGKPK